MPQRVLFFQYVLTDHQGAKIDSSYDRGGPMPVLEGAHQIIPALEAELFAMTVGEKKKVNLSAEQAYGPVIEQLKIKVNRSRLPQGDIRIGSQFHGGDKTNHMVFTVTQMEGEEIHLDGNHPLAGRVLNFEVEVTEIREATAEELTHGHAHGPDGHHH